MPIITRTEMKKIIISALLAVTAIMSLHSQESETYFPYPNIPENLTNLDDRSNYFVAHFWERCNLKSAFSAKDMLKKAFNDYIAIMPYAHLDTVNASVRALIKEVKKNPQNLLTLGLMAQEALYSDSAQYWSDELYLLFARAVADNKKISKADRAKFEYHANVLEYSQEGMIAYNLPFENERKEKCHLNDISAPYIILFINEPDCDDCMIARVRLAANIKTRQLIDAGTLKIVSLSPCEADEEWRNAVAGYPEQWIKGASPEVDSYFDMKSTPCIYLLDQNHKILVKNVDINALITTMSRL